MARPRNLGQNIEIETDEPDLSNIMIDATYVKCHMHASGARGGNQGMAVSKGDYTRRCMPLKILISDGNMHDSPRA